MNDDIVKTLLESLTDEQKAQLVQGLSQPKDTEEKVEEAVSSSPRRKVSEDFTVNRISTENKRKSPVKFKKNKWVDEGEDRDPNVDYEKLERTPRRRGKPSKKNVECHVCGKSFAMNESLIYGEFIRCNRCTGR